MKKLSLIAAILIFTFALTCIAQETCKRYVESNVGISFCPPEDWSIEERSGEKFKIVIGPRSDIFTPNIIVSELNVPVSLKDIVSFTIRHYSENAKDVGATYIKVLNQSEFATSSNQQGIKVAFGSETKGLLLRTTQYYFSGKGDSKLIITFTALERDSKALDPTFDSSMKTLQIEK